MPQHPEIAALAVTLQECRNGQDGDASIGCRKMTALRYAADLEKTPVREGDAPMGLNVRKPEWIANRTSAM
jgi:hypothetical protein